MNILPLLAIFSNVAISCVSPLAISANKEGAEINVDEGKLFGNKSLAINSFYVAGGSGCCPGQDKEKEETTTTAPAIPVNVQIDDPWVMVIGGDNSTGKLLQNVEVFSLDEQHHPVPACLRKLSDFPVGIEDGSGGSVQNGRLPLVCGGRASETQHNLYSDECFSYEAATDTWMSAGRMPMDGGGFGYNVHPEIGLVVTGGDYGVRERDTGSLNTLVATRDGTVFTSGEEKMPIAAVYPCQVIADADTLYSLGGLNAKRAALGNAFKFSFRSKKWTAIPPMPTARYLLTCGAVRNDAGDATSIVAAGGFGSAGQQSAAVEILSLASMSWKAGTSLPRVIVSARAVPFRNSFAIVGGHSSGLGDRDTVLVYDPAGAGSWKALPNKLGMARRQTVAFNVRKDVFPKCP